MPIVQITHSVELPVELTSPPESTFFFQSVLHSSVVTKWLRIVCINYSQGNFEEIMLAHWTKPQQRTFPTLSLFVLQSPFKFWIWMMFCRYWWWHSSYVTDIYEFLFWYLAPVLMTGNRLGTKQTWAITRQTEVFSHLQWTALQQCVQCWPEPPSHHIETRHHHTRRFNAKWNTTQAMLAGGETRIWILGAWCETGPGSRWVVILQTWMEVR